MGNEITPDEYLESSLESQSGYDAETLSRNRTRSILTSFFSERSCHTLVRPVDSEEKLQALDDQPWDALRPQFRDQFTEFKDRLLRSLKPKTISGLAVDGPMFAALARTYVAAMNDKDAVPCIDDAWVSAIKTRSANLVATCVDGYEREVVAPVREEIKNKASLSSADLEKRHEKARLEAVAHFERECVKVLYTMHCAHCTQCTALIMHSLIMHSLIMHSLIMHSLIMHCTNHT
jgi:hypothetical protein